MIILLRNTKEAHPPSVSGENRLRELRTERIFTPVKRHLGAAGSLDSRHAMCMLCVMNDGFL